MSARIVDLSIPVRKDTVTFPPWEAHRVMLEREYYHLENLANLDRIGRSHDFKISAFPIKWTGSTAAPVRAVAIVEE